ncbi:NERD domain-containing protein [Winogradskyella sp. DF17]|uniref:NERD domain-containing protein n=1 Tax=Winogradskyella pelagia TaxID=2819984 RepID=A0ABS3T429_9FLAO|nr:nuclease-related domain-containing protein [Winogradskyella sp. DF17]MBO3117495.1 NERD domain-containing protein [Winogradskyella sp. DF17]
MAKVIGQIESLKTLKKELKYKGLTQFSSVGDIKAFLSSHKAKKQHIKQQAEQELEQELIQFKEELQRTEQTYEKQTLFTSEQLKLQLEQLKERRKSLSDNKPTFFLWQLFHTIKLSRVNRQIDQFEHNFNAVLRQKMQGVIVKMTHLNKKINHYTDHRTEVIAQKAQPEIKKLERTKTTLENLKPLMYGAIGEHKVQKELEKLPEDFIVINDFNVHFQKPLFYKAERSYISSIQIDHLVLGPSGIFIIETKNWSQKSINNLDLRSPVAQIKRTSHALYRMVHTDTISDHVFLGYHPWGEKKIPIRNLIVMVNNKPKENFQYVSIKTLKEVNGYIQYFEPCLSKTELRGLKGFLRSL